VDVLYDGCNFLRRSGKIDRRAYAGLAHWLTDRLATESITIVARVNHPPLDMIQSAARNVIHRNRPSLSLSLSLSLSVVHQIA